MEFSRIGNNSIRCLISEAEIEGLGYTLDELLGNGIKTQEFMNRIFEIAEREYGLKMEFGMKTVRADFLPNHTVSLTFSDNQSQTKVNGIMEHLLDYVNEMLTSSKDKLEKLNQEKKAEQAVEDQPAADPMEEPQIIIMLAFESMSYLCQYAKNITLDESAETILYKYGDTYYLMLNLSDQNQQTMMKLWVHADEYASNLIVGKDKWAFMREHATVIIPEHAVETLKQI